MDDVKLKQRYGNIGPDIVLVSNGKELFIEIIVTHMAHFGAVVIIPNANSW